MKNPETVFRPDYYRYARELLECFGGCKRFHRALTPNKTLRSTYVSGFIVFGKNRHEPLCAYVSGFKGRLSCKKFYVSNVSGFIGPTGK